MRFLIVIIITLYSVNIWAECSEIACTGIGEDALVSVFPNSSGNIYLQAGSDRNNLDCTLVDGYYMTLKPDHPLFEEIYSTILTALMARKRLTVRIKNGSSVCEVSYARMFM